MLLQACCRNFTLVFTKINLLSNLKQIYFIISSFFAYSLVPKVY